MSTTTKNPVTQRLDELAGDVADLTAELELDHDKDLLEEAAWCIRAVAELQRMDEEP